jgi:nitrate/TMAO reductase-like tetraheme cytochrome c subunit
LTERDYRHRPVARPWYRKAWFTWVVVIVFAAIFIGILVYPVAALDNASYCTSCKAMQPAQKSLSNSSHAGIDCTECHIPPGLAASFRWRLGETRNVWADYLGMPTSAQKESPPTNAACLRCHPLEGIPNETAGVKMDHEVHLQLRNLLCIDCHDTVSHALPGQSQDVSMITCAMCHSEQGSAPADCDFCHPEPPASEHAPDFMKEHGKKALANPDDCLRCHHDKEQFCDACHDFPPPSHYSGDWRYSHGQPAAADPANCEACHDEAYCSQCHQVNHPSTWVETHGAIAAKGLNACLVCHPQSMCDECHEQNGVEVDL